MLVAALCAVAVLQVTTPAEAARTHLGGVSRKNKPSAWEICAEEGSLIAAGAEGNVRVRFGWGDDWVEANVPGGSLCDYHTFSDDPAPGTRKECRCTFDGPEAGGVHSSHTHLLELGVEWTLCAAEGGDCTCPSGRVRFGANGRWVLLDSHSAGAGAVFLESNKTKATRCDAKPHGQRDPAPGKKKECWCAGQQAKAPIARSAVIMLSRHPPDFDVWLRYHLDYMGVEHVFIEVEDTPGFNATWSALPDDHRKRVTVWHAGSSEGRDASQRPADDYESLQKRQLRAMRRARDAASSMGIQWLLHIDDDELLWSPISLPLAAVLAELPQEAAQAFIPNVEAVYPSAEVKNCFTETEEVNVNRFLFASYANGKAAVRLEGSDYESVVPAGPHTWISSDGVMLPSVKLTQEPLGAPLYVVHFESCPLARWKDKFWELGNTKQSKIKQIPFQFYRDSIERMQHCTAARDLGNVSTADAGCSLKDLKSLWSRWKTEENPRLTREDLMPLTIPWKRILAH